MFIPTRDIVLEMNPTDFEKYCVSLLKEQTKNLENVLVEHNKIIITDDGNYQIDGIIEFDIVGVRIKVLVECKHYKYPISREKVQILHDKIRSTGYHKGILISTSNFQTGAIEYATKHGIALIQVSENEVEYETRALDVIMQSHRIPNTGEPYLFVMQEKSIGITCKYLRKGTNYLAEFITKDYKVTVD